MKEHRKLAAIMFTDITGYSALMSKDEKIAMRVLEKNRSIHKSAMSRFNGEYIKEIGDGTLAIFPSSIDAVQCAIAIQKAYRKEPSIKIRIGIHTGDIVQKKGDIFGDGVNIGSRIEAAGEPGGIYISEKVYDDIKNKSGIHTVFFGKKFLKNIPDPVKIYSVVLEQKKSGLAESETDFQQSFKKKSIAVLPFVDMSPEKDQDYFCDGITEEIINTLSHAESFKVIARTSCFAFKDKKVDIREIGRILNVETLLEGSIRKAGNRLRIAAQLIKVADGSHIWSERYDRDMDDVFAIQDEIALAILNNLKVNFLGGAHVIMAKRHSENLEAYNLYLKGTYHFQTLTSEGLKKALTCFEQALRKDPSYVLAYVGLGYVNWLSATWGNVPPDEAYPRAHELADKTLQLDNSLAEAYSLLGTIHTFYHWNWKEAERNFKHALEINPNSSMIHINYSALLTFTGRHEEAIREAKRAQEIDPLSCYINTRTGEAFHYAGKIDQAIEEYRMTLTINPNYYLAHGQLGRAYFFAKEMVDEGLAEYEKATELSGGRSYMVASLAGRYYQTGKTEQADALFLSLRKRAEIEYVPPVSFYLIHWFRGEENLAFEWLKRACNQHDTFLPWLRSIPVLFPEGSRYEALLREVGL
ncbi:MAG: hypothetical protein MUC31_03640 [Bacteroidales bacterium]|nr:hypothetical protein [Bacteroidales bacterium]